jgi:homocitrate synthase NifV
MTPAERIWMVDTTLRDGEQAPGVVFHPLEKIEVAWGLAAAGIDEIEAGIPAMGDHACQEIIALSRLDLPCILSCWCRAVREEIILAARCSTPGVHISFPTSSILLKTFGKSEAWVLDLLEDLVLFSRQYFDQVSVGAQDATRTGTRFLLRFASRCRELKVHRLRLADTVGMASPVQIMKMIRDITAALPGLSLEFHGHNDLGMATANAVSAVDAGADSLSVTINGLGERAGNAPLEEVAMALFGLGARTSNLCLERLDALCRMTARYSGQPIPPSKPIVGDRVFSHESGIHCAGLLRNAASYQPFDPKTVGRASPSLVLGSHSGTAIICHLLEKKGIFVDKPMAGRLLSRVRHEAAAGKKPVTPERLEAIYQDMA